MSMPTKADIERRLKEQEALVAEYRAVIGMMPEVAVVYFKGTDMTVDVINDVAVRIVAQPKQRLMGKRWLKVVPAMEVQSAVYDDVLIRGKKVDTKAVRIDLLGGSRWFNTSYRPVRDKSGEIVGMVIVAQDITEKKGLEILYEDLYRNAPAGYFSLNLDGVIIRNNPVAESLLGYDVDEIVGQHFLNLCAHTPYGKDKAHAIFTRFLAGEEIVDEELQMVTKDGTIVWISLSVNAVRDDNGRIVESRSVVINIEHRKRLEAQVEHDLYHDALTGLANRILFFIRLEEAVKNGLDYAVLFLDLDQFKTVNDSFGHTIGDALLKIVARRLKGIVQESDTVARLGGDEFVILLVGVTDIGAIEKVCARIIKSLSAQMLVNGYTVFTGCSIGFTVSAQSGEDVNSVMRYADVAMYAAKNAGRGGYKMFDSSMLKDVQSRLKMEADLKEAVERKEFRVEYQPIMDVQTEKVKVIGFEALVRWHHPDLGYLTAGQFVLHAERIDLISQIGEFVLWEACRQMAVWQKEFSTELIISVNISGKQLTGALVPLIERILQETGLKSKYLSLEITETALISNREVASVILKGLRNLGIGVSLDDFGTAYSPLSYLSEFPISSVKIDKKFVQEMDDRVILTIMDAANRFDLQVIAEGAENQEHIDFLRKSECQLVQGYFFSKPLEVSNVPMFIKKILASTG